MANPSEWHVWVWLLITLISLALSTYLPIRIKNPNARRLVNIVLLIPICFVIMFYVYPVGIELFKKWALTF